MLSVLLLPAKTNARGGYTKGVIGGVLAQTNVVAFSRIESSSSWNMLIYIYIYMLTFDCLVNVISVLQNILKGNIY
jgi:hypothetical protein